MINHCPQENTILSEPNGSNTRPCLCPGPGPGPLNDLKNRFTTSFPFIPFEVSILPFEKRYEKIALFV